MTRTRSRATAVVAAAIALPLLLAACGGDASSSETPAATAAATAAATPAPTSTALVGGDPSTWAPVDLTLDDNNAQLDWVVGQTAILTDMPSGEADNITVMSSNPTAVEPVQGDETTNPGFRAIAPGYARIVVWDGYPADGAAQPIAQYTVRVTNDPNADGNPWNEAPYEITGTSITLQAGGGAMWDSMELADGDSITSSAPEIAEPWNVTTGDIPGFNAVGVGEAKVEVKNAAGKVVAEVAVIVTP